VSTAHDPGMIRSRSGSAKHLINHAFSRALEFSNHMEESINAWPAFRDSGLKSTTLPHWSVIAQVVGRISQDACVG
jgi:hypothetical protein